MVVELSHDIVGPRLTARRQELANAAFKINGALLEGEFDNLVSRSTHEAQQEVDEDHPYGHVEDRCIEHF